MKLFYAVAMGLTIAASSTASTASTASPTFVTVNGVKVDQDTAQLYVEMARSNGATDPAELREQAKQEIIRRELLLEAAHKSGFDKRPDVVADADEAKKKFLVQAEVARQTVIIRRYMQDYLRSHPISDGQLKGLYQSMKYAGGGKEFRAHQILTKNQSDAEVAIKRLKEGARLDQMGKEANDPSRGIVTSDLGWTVPGRLLAPVGAALKPLNKGEFTPMPIKADDGFHVILVDDTRPLNLPAFEDMKPMLLKQAQDEMLVRITQDLQRTAKID